MFKALWGLIKFIFRFIRDSIILTIIVLGVNLLLNPVGLSEFKKLGNIPQEITTTDTTKTTTTHESPNNDNDYPPQKHIIKVTQNGGQVLSDADYMKAVDHGLPKGNSMTVPANNGVYLVYIKPNKDDAFNVNARNAVNSWITEGRIPMRVTDDKKQAQIEINLTDDYLSGRRKDGAVTTGITTMAEHSLETKTSIIISKAACENTCSGFKDTVEHELGHALGLEHNQRPNDLMNAVNRGTVHLTRYDIDQAQRNYHAVEHIKTSKEDQQ